MKTIPLLVALLSLGQVSSQSPERAFERARLIEEKEGDLRAAETAWRELLAMADLPPTVANGANLRLGQLLWSLDRKDEARPFLEHVIAKGDAAAAAAAQAVLDGKWDPARQAELRRQAEELVQRLGLIIVGRDESPARDEAWWRTVRSLRTLGEPAAKALAARLRGSWPTLADATRALAPQDLPRFAKIEIALVAELWQVGTPPAKDYFETVLAHENRALRELMVPLRNIAADMQPLAVRFLHDADPDGNVARAARPIAGELPKEVVLDLLRAEPAPARAAGYSGAKVRFLKGDAAAKAAWLQDLAPFLDRGMNDRDEDVHREAWSLTEAIWRSGLREAVTLVLRNLVSAPPDSDWSDTGSGRPLDDAEFALLHAAGKALSTNQQRDSRHNLVQYLLGDHVPQWTRSFGLLLDLLPEYGRHGSANWLRAVPLATSAERVELLRRLPQVHDPARVVGYLVRSEVPAEIMPAIRELWPDAASLNVALGLLQLAGKSKSPDAAAWLAEVTPGLDKGLHGPLVQALVQLSFDGVGEPALAELRRMLVADTGTAEMRALALAELTRRGDTGVLPLLARSVAMGLGHATSHPAGAAPPGLLCLSDEPSRQQRRWSGYSDAELAAAWRTVLADEPARSRYLNDMSSWSGSGIPVVATRALLEVLPTAEDSFLERLPYVGSCLQRLTADQLMHDEQLAAALRAALSAKRPESILVMLSDEFVRDQAVDLRQIADSTSQQAVFLARFLRADVPLATDDWVTMLGHAEVHLMDVLARLPSTIEPAVQTAIEKLLRSPMQSNRIGACQTLGRLLSRESVAPLLATLRDPTPEVREAATRALEQIRFYQDQVAHWQQIGAGPDVSREHAARRLVAQAQATAPREQRLLAIRSLGVLRAAETLPFLIDWTTDADADVAQAARDACARVHQTGATQPPEDARK